MQDLGRLGIGNDAAAFMINERAQIAVSLTQTRLLIPSQAFHRQTRSSGITA